VKFVKFDPNLEILYRNLLDFVFLQFPDAIADHFLHHAGVELADPRLVHMLSVAAHKYASELLKGAHAVSEAKVAAGADSSEESDDDEDATTRGEIPSPPLVELTTEDLDAAAKERGMAIDLTSFP
jgi:hypothetical protein